MGWKRRESGVRLEVKEAVLKRGQSVEGWERGASGGGPGVKEAGLKRGQSVDGWERDSLDKGAGEEEMRLNEQLCWGEGFSRWGRVESESFSSGSKTAKME